MLGAGDGSLLFDLLKQTELIICCLEPDAGKRNRIRAILDEAGLLGMRAQLHSGSFDEISYAPYCGNCIIWGSKLGSSAHKVDFKGLYRSLRPWGGVAYELSDNPSGSASRSKLAGSGVPEKEIADGSFGTVVKRGPLPGAGEWTRGHANPGNTFSSGDDIVKLPLGILWWGGVGPEQKQQAQKLIPLHGVLTQKVKSGKYNLRNPSVVWKFLGMAGNRMIGALGFDAVNLKHTGLAIPHQSRYIVVPVEGDDDAAGFRFNSDFAPITGTARPWIYSSGFTDEISLKVLGVKPKAYRVLLHFMEPEQVQQGDRVFDMLINGKTVLSQVDIFAETGSPNKALVKEVKGVGPCTTVEFSLKRVSGKHPTIVKKMADHYEAWWKKVEVALTERWKT